MDALEFLILRKEMCDAGCKDCPVSKSNNGHNMSCDVLMEKHPTTYVRKVREWKIRVKTNKEIYR